MSLGMEIVGIKSSMSRHYLFDAIECSPKKVKKLAKMNLSWNFRAQNNEDVMKLIYHNGFVTSTEYLCVLYFDPLKVIRRETERNANLVIFMFRNLNGFPNMKTMNFFLLLFNLVLLRINFTTSASNCVELLQSLWFRMLITQSFSLREIILKSCLLSSSSTDCKMSWYVDQF